MPNFYEAASALILNINLNIPYSNNTKIKITFLSFHSDTIAHARLMYDKSPPLQLGQQIDCRHRPFYIYPNYDLFYLLLFDNKTIVPWKKISFHQRYK